MLKTLAMLITGFIAGLILSENAQIIRHSIPKSGGGSGNASGNINQFIFILGIGNSGNDFKINTYPENDSEEEEESINE
jgi:hypothetical protein